jgi:hypothetical protein
MKAFVDDSVAPTPQIPPDQAASLIAKPDTKSS